ncbi:DUF6804 family protein [Mucilaginibacter sp.]
MKPLLILSIVLLLCALFPLPIGYYTLLRIIVCITAVMTIVNEYRADVTPWIIALGLCAVVFNPILPIYLNDKEIWAALDITVAIVFTIKLFQLTKEKQSTTKEV